MEGIYEKEKELSERISKKQPRFVPFAVIVGCGLLYLHSWFMTFHKVGLDGLWGLFQPK